MLAYVALARIYDKFSAEAARLFRQHGLSQPQYNALRTLYMRGGDDGLPTRHIAERLVNRVPDITRLIDRLVRGGYVERTSKPTDRRVVLVNLTARGREVVESINKPIVALHESQFSHLTTRELTGLVRVLDKVGG